MQRVNTLVSSSIGDTLTNIKTWGSIAYIGTEHGVIEGGLVDTTETLQALVNKAISEGRRTIFLPHITNGQYYVTSLTNADQVDFVGDNSTFVGGYAGTIGNLGGFAELKIDVTQRGINAKSSPYNAVGDGITDDTEAFSRVEAASGEIVFLPEGTYVVNGITLSKKYIGPGKINLNSLKHSRYTNITELPAFGSYAWQFDGDQRWIDAEHFVIQNLPERNHQLQTHYFNWELIPHLINFDNYTGNSGWAAHVDADSAAGQKILFVSSTEQFLVGQEVIVADYSAKKENCVIASIQSGVSLTMVSNLQFTHLSSERHAISTGSRTMHSAYHTQVRHVGSGDCFGHMFRVTVEKAPEPGQDHVFETSTGGMYGGDMYATVSGVYLTGSEKSIGDTTYYGSADIAAVGDVVTLMRNNSTGAKGAFWFGTFFNSTGTAWADGCHVVSGKYKSGLDTTYMTTDADKSAIRMAAEQKIYFDCSSTPDVAGFKHYGNVIGDTWVGYVDGLFKINVDSGNAISMAATAMYTGGHVHAGLNLSVPQGQRIMLEGPTGDTYLTFNGTNILLFKNGVQVATW